MCNHEFLHNIFDLCLMLGETYNIAKWVHNNNNSNRKQCLFATCLERMLLFSWLLNISWRFSCHWGSWRWWWRRRRWFIHSYPFSAIFYTILIICLSVCPSVCLSFPIYVNSFFILFYMHINLFFSFNLHVIICFLLCCFYLLFF